MAKAQDANVSIEVIIPSYNNKRYIKEAIDSVLSQVFPISRLIVVDDGSTDGSPEYIESLYGGDSRILLVRLEHLGVSAARNVGIALTDADTKLIAFLDSDDRWEPMKLEEQIPKLSSSVGVVYCAYKAMDDYGKCLNNVPICAPSLRGDIFGKLLRGNVVSGSASAMIVRRKLLEECGGFDEALRFGEDWDLWLRLARCTKFDFSEKPLVFIRMHQQQSTHANIINTQRKLRDYFSVLSRYCEGRMPILVMMAALDMILSASLQEASHKIKIVSELRKTVNYLWSLPEGDVVRRTFYSRNITWIASGLRGSYRLLLDVVSRVVKITFSRRCFRLYFWSSSK